MSEASDSPTLSILLDETKDSAPRVECLLPLVYDQLRAVAQRALAAERPDSRRARPCAIIRHPPRPAPGPRLPVPA